MSFVVVTGAGATGLATARQFAQSGERVRQITRSGNGVEHHLVERIAADVTDAHRLTDLSQGARVLVNCAIPAYDRWAQDVPPLAAALLITAERTGADYIMLGNTYGYGPVAGPITEDLPMAATTLKGLVRARMWLDALAAHQAGRVRVTEVRAGSFLGAGAVSGYTLFVPAAILAGDVAAYPGDLDVAQSWTYTEDVARTLVAASQNDRVWGKAWHAPVTSTLSVRGLTVRLAELAAMPAPKLRRIHLDELTAMAAQTPLFGELIEMLYSTEQPHVLDATHTEAELNLRPTSLDVVLRETLTALGTGAGHGSATGWPESASDGL